jgi:hypothetical protein
MKNCQSADFTRISLPGIRACQMFFECIPTLASTHWTDGNDISPIIMSVTPSYRPPSFLSGSSIGIELLHSRTFSQSKHMKKCIFFDSRSTRPISAKIDEWIKQCTHMLFPDCGLSGKATSRVSQKHSIFIWSSVFSELYGNSKREIEEWESCLSIIQYRDESKHSLVSSSQLTFWSVDSQILVWAVLRKPMFSLD